MNSFKKVGKYAKRNCKKYINNLNEIKSYVEELVSLQCDKDIDKEVYKMGILSICVKFESSTSDLYQHLFKKKKVKYNHPWFYTREISAFLGINNVKEYQKARECWSYYNTMKHVNNITKSKRHTIAEKNNIHNYCEAFYWIHKSLIDLLNSFLYK